MTNESILSRSGRGNMPILNIHVFQYRSHSGSDTFLECQICAGVSFGKGLGDVVVTPYGYRA